jgi:hypothetical protein
MRASGETRTNDNHYTQVNRRRHTFAIEQRSVAEQMTDLLNALKAQGIENEDRLGTVWREITFLPMIAVAGNLAVATIAPALEFTDRR